MKRNIAILILLLFFISSINITLKTTYESKTVFKSYIKVSNRIEDTSLPFMIKVISPIENFTYNGSILDINAKATEEADLLLVHWIIYILDESETLMLFRNIRENPIEESWNISSVKSGLYTLELLAIYETGSTLQETVHFYISRSDISTNSFFTSVTIFNPLFLIIILVIRRRKFSR